MTCYETLSIGEAPPAPPAAAADFPMAHHLVKWWRNKFRNGYKKFQLGLEGERTDTEELVTRAASQCSAPPDLLPSEARALLRPASPAPAPAPAPTPPQHKPPRLRFEELTCDVQVHETTSRQQPLQFSFTLYDLDGHGRMTKDDIAGIVSTIYESIGKSVTVPHYGSKTIQVRLTVVPESPAAAERGGASARREGGRRRARRRKETPAAGTKPDCGDATDDERRSRLSVDDDSSCSGDRRERRTQPPRAAPVPPRAPSPSHKENANRERRHKKRSGSLQRKELLQIIQANMEKNHLSFQTSRKPPERPAPIHEEEIPTVKPQPRRHRDRAFTVSSKPEAMHKTKPEPPENNGYLDLAGPRMDSNLCRYDRYLHAVICSSATHANSGFHRKNLPTTPPIQPVAHKPHKTKTHNRSRSHDVPPQTPHEPRVLQIIFL